MIQAQYDTRQASDADIRLVRAVRLACEENISERDAFERVSRNYDIPAFEVMRIYTITEARLNAEN